MSRISQTVAKGWQESTNLSGVTTASLLAVLLVSTIVGGLAGIVLDGAASPVALAVLAGLVGTIAAGIVRNTVLIRAWDAAGVEDSGTPAVVVIYAAVASLAGSLAAHQLISGAGPVWPGVTGMLAGLLSAGLMGLLMVAYRMQPAGGSDRW